MVIFGLKERGINMLDQILGFVMPIIAYMGEKYGVVGTVIAYATLVVAPIVSVLIELFELVASVTASKSDDATAAKIKAFWAKVLPVMEMLPHVNLPIAAAALKAVDMVKKVAEVLKSIITGIFKK
jgi:hypothetical protein